MLEKIFFRSVVNHPKSFCNCRSLSSVKKEHTQARTTHFGFDTVNEDEKATKVHKVFESVAKSYDVMNDVMSFGVHRLWKDIFMLRLSPTPGTQLLDVAGGTGDIAFRFLNYLKTLPQNPGNHKNSKVTVSDINQLMLDEGKKRADTLGYKTGEDVDWLLADAENLPIDNEMYSAYTIAFGIRNVTHIDKVLDEAYRVLKPGGRFLCLEFSHVNNEIIRRLYDIYSFQMIPVMGQIVAGEWKPYQYLVESIRQFPNQEDFKVMIQSAGFSQVHYENLSFGVVAIHSGYKL